MTVKKSFSKSLSKKNLSKYFVFPITYLILELVEDVLIYKSELVGNHWTQAVVVMGVLVFGISLVAFALVPFFQGGLESLRKSHKKHGPLGEFLFTASVLLAIYLLYYIKVSHGGNIESLLPDFFHN